jgi:hypothetical protein
LIRGLTAAALLCGVLVLARGDAAAAELLDFLYVEGNVGVASGGHVALRLDDDVYHYQNAGSGQLRLMREDFDFFRHTYSVLQNRTIHVSRLDVSDDTRRAVGERFQARYLIEQAHFDRLAAQHEDVALLARMHGTGDPPQDGPASRGLRARGAGFFALDRGADGAEASLVALRRRIAAVHGAEYLGSRQEDVARSQHSLRPDSSGPVAPSISKDRWPPASYAFSRRFRDLAEQRLALEVLVAATPLRSEVLRSGTEPALALNPAERQKLARFAERLEEDLTALVSSQRPDWGHPLLVGMARLAALAESLRTNRLVVVDAYPADAGLLAGSTGEARTAYLREVHGFAVTRLAEARDAFFGGEPGEREYSALESALNRALEVQGGLEQGGPVRLAPGHLVPERRADVPDGFLPPAQGTDLPMARDVARQRERDTTRALDEIYGYDLVRRNCVSEVFATLAAAFGPAELEARMGGTVGPEDGFAFIPFVASRAVRRAYRIEAVGEIPSYRRTRMAEMYASESPIAVYLRETNTLTSSVYRRNPHDSFFVFFTDDTPWPRPLFGAINLVAGLGEALTGVIRLPVDGGRSLWSGAKGAFFSLPELAFINVRKGSLEYGRTEAPRTQLHPTSQPRP